MKRLINRVISAVLGGLLFMMSPGPALASADVINTYILNGKVSDSSNHKPGDDFKLIQDLGSGYSRYYDYPLGYALDFPSGMTPDFSAYPVKTVLNTADDSMEIYFDNFSGSVHDAARYIKWSRNFLTQNSVDQIDQDKYIVVKCYQVQLLQWHRPKLSSLPADKNYYLRAIFVKNTQEVLTLLIKSAEPIDANAWMRVINSVDFMPAKGLPSFNTAYTHSEPAVNQETRNCYQQYFADTSALSWGIFEPTADAGLFNLNSLEKRLGYDFSCLLWYQSLGSEFPRQLVDQAWSQGKILELTLATWDLRQPDNKAITYDILNGQYDNYLTEYARKIKDFGHPMLFRLNNEMNGEWCYWSAYNYDTDTELFRAMWRHIYGIFRAQGADNLLWVWNPNELSFPGFKWNAYINYFPGDGYVDIIGLTGYNTGNYYPGERWRDFRAIYAPLYWEYSKVFDYPFMITEFACSSIGGDKPAWIQDMFQQINNYPKIKLAIWFNGVDLDANGNPARIYRLDLDNKVIQEFARGLNQESK